MVAGGREVMFGDDQYEIFNRGANAFVIGDYLTTAGKSPKMMLNIRSIRI